MRQKVKTRVLSVVLATTMILANGMTVMASSAGSSGTTSTPAAVAPVVSEAENTVNSTVVGVGTSTVSGSYTAKSVNGSAVKASAATVSANLGLGNNERAYVTTWDVTPKTSPKAVASLQIGADSVGATMGPIVQVNVNKMSGGKLTSLEGQGGTVPMSFGIPANFRGAGNFAMVKVISGGQYTILQDQDTNPNTLTVNVGAGNAAYAMIKYNG